MSVDLPETIHTHSHPMMRGSPRKRSCSLQIDEYSRERLQAKSQKTSYFPAHRPIPAWDALSPPAFPQRSSLYLMRHAAAVVLVPFAKSFSLGHLPAEKLTIKLIIQQ
jgi:hypothetical protein